MTDNTMREGKLWAFLHDSIHEAYKKLSMTGTRYEYYAMLDAIASKITDDIESDFLQDARSVPVVEEPVRKALECGQLYYVAGVSGGRRAELYWSGDIHDHIWLKHGVIHLTREAAELHSKALILVSGGKVAE